MRSSCQRDETMEIVLPIGLGVGGEMRLCLLHAAAVDSMLITAVHTIAKICRMPRAISERRILLSYQQAEWKKKVILEIHSQSFISVCDDYTMPRFLQAARTERCVLQPGDVFHTSYKQMFFSV